MNQNTKTTMTNAKTEFLELMNKVNAPPMCAVIYEGDPDDKDARGYSLTVGYGHNEFDSFLKAIDFKYDAGYGGQELFGTIWFADGTWAERGECDGREWWEYKECPEIPKFLNKQ
jgi:hypothetical protein